ncbi:MAG: homoserine O-succinyltransferase [Proteobacteria bacterium]|nr:homoserine O-succinyltransferase [Pseudomonadota bacterium]
MPLVRHHALPVFDELEAQGKNILPLDRATQQDIRELHIGLLNMMPDAALEPTERQFLNLVGSSNQIAQLYVYPFTIEGLDRGEKASTHIDTHYTAFEEIRAHGLDALIVTGANVTRPDLSAEPFWEPLLEVINWASQSVTSILCSCLASHVLLEHIYGLRRTPLSRKRWGVYRHRVARIDHPLLADVNTLFDVPHSRWNDIPRVSMEAAGVVPLITTADGDVHLAVSADGLRYVFLQGHPEYDINSLLKEYKREVRRFAMGEIDEHPPLPERYFTFDALDLVERHRAQVVDARRQGQTPPEFPDDALEPLLDNTWGDSAKTLFNNWLGLVYRLTHLDRKKPFADGIDPNDPLQRGKKWSLDHP